MAIYITNQLSDLDLAYFSGLVLGLRNFHRCADHCIHIPNGKRTHYKWDPITSPKNTAALQDKFLIEVSVGGTRESPEWFANAAFPDPSKAKFDEKYAIVSDKDRARAITRCAVQIAFGAQFEV